jgi:serine/threonine protein phosphatase 1
MKEFVVGDIHGAYKALEQCLKRSGFDYENDVLIQLGDIVDGYPDAFECVEELLKIKNLISIKGNHDQWFDEFIKTDFHPYYWTYGGKGTLISYLKHAGKEGRYFATGSGFKTSFVSTDIPDSHKKIFRNQLLYHIDDMNRCFVHGGFVRNVPFLHQAKSEYYWNRSLWSEALDQQQGDDDDFTIATKFSEIFIGHSPTTHWGADKPLTAFNITNLDTGAGHTGRLTIMDVATKEFWQSDPLPELYAENFRD